MIIRKAQIDKLNKFTMQAFEDEMIQHLAEFSPALFDVIKEDQLRVAVRHGIKKAEEYGFTFRGPIRLYLEMMLLFGSSFDTDPQYPWASEILNDQEFANAQMHRAEQLYEKIVDYQEKVSGEKAINTRKALEELLNLAQKEIKFSSNNTSEGIRQEMKRIFPQKAEYVGKEAMKALINQSGDVISKYKLPGIRAEVMMASLMFAFGHGCNADPLYPWIERTLNDKKIVDSAARAERLEKKAVTWLSHVLAKRKNSGEA